MLLFCFVSCLLVLVVVVVVAVAVVVVVAAAAAVVVHGYCTQRCSAIVSKNGYDFMFF